MKRFVLNYFVRLVEIIRHFKWLLFIPVSNETCPTPGILSEYSFCEIRARIVRTRQERAKIVDNRRGFLQTCRKTEFPEVAGTETTAPVDSQNISKVARAGRTRQLVKMANLLRKIGLSGCRFSFSVCRVSWRTCSEGLQAEDVGD